MPETDEAPASLSDYLQRMSDDDQLSTLVAALVDLLCVRHPLSLTQARKLIALEMGAMYPHVAFEHLPVSARLQ